ncbi:MAG: hypothetical protein WCG23_12305 [bacterium]
MEKLKQEINYQVQLRNAQWTVFLLLATGTTSLVFKIKEGLIELIMFILGLIFILIIIKGCFKRDEYIVKLINKLEKEKP